jgi:hypothetical protein
MNDQQGTPPRTHVHGIHVHGTHVHGTYVHGTHVHQPTRSMTPTNSTH